MGLGHHARVGGVDAVHIGVDAAALGTDGGCDRNRRGVRAAAAKRGDAAGFLMHALEPGNDCDLCMFLELLDQFGAVHIKDAG